MDTKKIRVAVLFGGKSAEHDVSLRSAKNIITALDPKKYETTEIMIPKTGIWDMSMEMISAYDVVFPILHGPLW